MFLYKDSYLPQMNSGMCSEIMFLSSFQLCDRDLEEGEKSVLAGRCQNLRKNKETNITQEKDQWHKVHLKV